MPTTQDVQGVVVERLRQSERGRQVTPGQRQMQYVVLRLEWRGSTINHIRSVTRVSPSGQSGFFDPPGTL